MGKEPIVYVIFDETNKIIISATTNEEKAKAIKDKEQSIHDIYIQILAIYPSEVEDMLKNSYSVQIYTRGFSVREMAPSEVYSYGRENIDKCVSASNIVVVYADDEFDAVRKAKAIISESKKEE